MCTDNRWVIAIAGVLSFLRVAGSHAVGIGHGAFAYRQSDPRCDTKRGAVDNPNMINLCARIIAG
jgi:hypothetical protein